MTPERRSAVMSRVRSAGTSIERKVRCLLHRAGYRYRVNVRGLPGSPDVAFGARRKAIFVNGCFWHGHEGCSRGRLPATRRDFWEAKIARNQQRDRTNQEQLAAAGWSVLVLWQCQLSDGDLSARLAEFLGPPRLPKGRAHDSANERGVCLEDLGGR